MEEEEEDWVGLAASQGGRSVRGEEVEDEAGEADRYVTWWRYIIISDILLFHFSKIVSMYLQFFFHHLL